MTKKSTISDADMDSVSPKKRKMRPGGGKAKGNSFEGQVAKKLSAALAPLNFIRSPGSGARVGGKNFEKFGDMFGAEAMKIFTADVVPINERKAGLTFLHSIECKSYADSDSFTSLAANTANIFKWFKESEVDALKTSKFPMLIFKWNRTPVFVIVKKSHTAYTDLKQETPLPRFELTTYDLESDGCCEQTLQVHYFDDLLKCPTFWCTPHDYSNDE